MKALHRNAVSMPKLIALLKKHKRIKVSIIESDGDGYLQRERILKSDGTSKVRYFNPIFKTNAKDVIVKDEKGKPVVEKLEATTYGYSCFMSFFHKEWGDPSILAIKNKAERIVRAMKKHDQKYYVIQAVYTGKNFKKKIG